jgi:hypothetical protein
VVKVRARLFARLRELAGFGWSVEGAASRLSPTLRGGGGRIGFRRAGVRPRGAQPES